MLLLLLLSRFSRARLCDPIDGSPPGSSVHGIFQARVLEWVAMAFFKTGHMWGLKRGIFRHLSLPAIANLASLEIVEALPSSQ